MIGHISRADWRKERLIWIAFNKNNDNDECLFSLLSKDIVLEIIKFFKTDMRLDNFSRTDYCNDDDQALNNNNNNDQKDVDVDHNNAQNNSQIDQSNNNLTIATRGEENHKQEQN